ncbi:Hsp20/alpha crystallin family protein [Halomarina oriensis]|uniref:Hsp20 family protein n=1 Tax=Halomarina oriensis TaxID=671145 RepID=A0A6B0GJB4_9EURY|nr:Hsp20/alpha crystallin family protein [Halomarina oriensis]MWG34874.1 Hsp20 family protein [Halomarina oriensis]
MSRRSPFDDIERMFEEMNEGFQAFDTSLTRGIPVDVVSREDAYVVTADLPGYEKEDIEVSLSGDTLTVGASRETTSEDENGDYVRQERSSKSVSRTLRLPERLDESATEAAYNNGVLTVTLGKASGDDGDSIPIN